MTGNSSEEKKLLNDGVKLNNVIFMEKIPAQGVNTQLSHICDKSTQRGIVQNGGVMNPTRHNYHKC